MDILMHVCCAPCFTHPHQGGPLCYRDTLEEYDIRLDTLRVYQGAIDKIQNDIIDKVDKWITDPAAQAEITAMLESYVEYLESQM